MSFELLVQLKNLEDERKSFFFAPTIATGNWIFDREEYLFIYALIQYKKFHCNLPKEKTEAWYVTRLVLFLLENFDNVIKIVVLCIFCKCIK